MPVTELQEAISVSAAHCGIPPEQIDKFIGTLALVGYEVVASDALQKQEREALWMTMRAGRALALLIEWRSWRPVGTRGEQRDYGEILARIDAEIKATVS